MSYTYQEAAQRGDAIGVVRQAVLFSALWALGSSWSIAIRKVVMGVVGGDGNAVYAEVAAASITTLIALSATFVATRRCLTASVAASAEEGGARNPPPTSRSLRPLPRALPRR